MRKKNRDCRKSFSCDRNTGLELAARYEQLRSDALSAPEAGNRSPGLALFLRKGTACWMRAWLACMNGCAAQIPPAPQDEQNQLVVQTSNVCALRPDVRGQLTSILAAMVVSRMRRSPDELGRSPES